MKNLPLQSFTVVLSMLCCALWTTIAQGGNPTLSLVPSSASGTFLIVGQEIQVVAGARIELEVHVADWDADLNGTPLLRGIQATLDWAGLVSGEQGSIDPFMPSCDVEADACGSLVHPLSECLLIGPGGAPACSPIVLDDTHADFIFPGVERIDAVDIHTDDVRFLALTSLSGDSVADPGQPMYVATLFLEATSDALGTFTIELLDVVNQEVDASMLLDESSALIKPLELTPALVTITVTSGVDNEQGAVPTISQWGVAAMMLLLLTAATYSIKFGQIATRHAQDR